MIRVVLADDHPIVRQGLRTVLETEANCRVVGEAADGLTALDLIAEHQPDIAILDVQMPDLGGLEVARRTPSKSPDTRVIMLSMHSDEPYVLEALRHGALAYVLKGSATTELVDAVHAVAAGKRFLSAPLNERALEVYAGRSGDLAQRPDRYDLLTHREREVLQLAAQGMTNAEIGERLAISTRTAETHRANFMRKLGLQSQTELVRFAVNRGFLPSND
ncbi:MAG TPA: response regulator transcription factor [Thermomicrobiales bacterium]|nr:response regulator transcription factor [Thermomicrobiales bacterium]